jgi:Na+-transporting methylmalonyl-CoA/oxaloacetate decarboxylase gamma subunit
MDQQLSSALLVMITGMAAISILFGLLMLTSLALNTLFPNTQAVDITENENPIPPHISPQVDKETIAVIQAAIATHLKARVVKENGVPL